MVIREIENDDRRSVGKIETAFETDLIYDVVVTPRTIELVEKRLGKSLTKRYAIGDVFAPWSTWDTGWVADDDGAIVGFAGVEYEAWHRRLVLWHLYVQPTHRRGGVGRALLAKAEAHGRELGAKRMWLETSNVNLPGIAAYERLGYRLCGADHTVYDGLPYQDEVALYFQKPL
jgi:GNAT superfamily N-acetyltransferase